MLDQHQFTAAATARKSPEMDQNLNSERGMNTTAAKVENVVDVAAQSEEPVALDALQELSTIELAYVGGGTYVASFV
jgi:hypothetical protein